MNNLELGFLFQKNKITYKDKDYEVFELLDFTTGFVFENAVYNEMCNLIYNEQNVYAGILGNTKYNDFLFSCSSIENWINENNKTVDILEYRNRLLKENVKYYLLSEDQKILHGIQDIKFTEYIDNYLNIQLFNLEKIGKY